MHINLIWDSSVNSAPSEFKPDVEQAASMLEQYFFSPITINITVGWGEISGTPITDPNIAEGGPSSQSYAYSQIQTALAQHVASPIGAAAVASLPTGSSLQGQTSFSVAFAEAKALGLMNPNATAIDGAIGFGTGWAGDEIIGGALHELTHAMGRVAGLAPFDFYRFTSPGTRLFGGSIPAPPAYFSLNGGTGNFASFDATSDPGDFADSTPNDVFDATLSGNGLTELDTELMDAIGYDSAASWIGISPSNLTGNVSAGADWNTGVAPEGNNAVIAVPGTYTVISNGDDRLLSLLLKDPAATLEIQAPTDFTLGNAPLDATSLNDGAIDVQSGATFSLSGALENSGLIKVNGLLSVTDGVIEGDGSVKVKTRAGVNLQGSLIRTGSVAIALGSSISSIASETSKLFVGSITLDGYIGAYSGSKLKVDANTLLGSGAFAINGATLVLKCACSLRVEFDTDIGTLVLARSKSFTGVVSNLTGSQIDLRDITFFSPSEANYVGSPTGGTLTVSDGSHTARIQLSGDYQASNFVTASDGHGGTLVGYPLASAAAVRLFAQHGAGLNMAPVCIGASARVIGSAYAAAEMQFGSSLARPSTFT